MGTWTGPFFVGSANRGTEQDDPEAGGKTVPQLMPVGSATLEMFACAGARSEDNALRTTWLMELMAPTGSPARGGSVTFIQDLLNGDDRFVPNRPGPLVGPANPPAPPINNRPGNPVREGSVQCAMTQLDDNVATRELNMLTISNGVLYHSAASSFGTATDGLGTPFKRFNAVSPWADVGQALGGGLGNIVAATLVASRPTAISVFFVAESGGRYRLFSSMRLAGSGVWRLPPDDVLAVNGGTLNGTTFPFKVAAGMCPVFGRPQDSELIYAMWDADRNIQVGRVAPAAQQWAPGIVGVYPPMSTITNLLARTGDPTRQATIQSLQIVARPFRDDARPPP
jgi:hypothetical protein